MKEFLTIRLSTPLDEQAICDHLKAGFPDFNWRRGDSDAQGPYVAGIDQAMVQIKCWMGERPVEITASFRSAWPDIENREDRKQKTVQQLIRLLGSLGEVSEVLQTN